jgi:cytochrome c biogenesis protein CcdA
VTSTAGHAQPAGGLRGLARRGYPRSFLIGAAFSAAWSPCIGPILGVVLTLAAASGTAAQGGLLLVCYALGLGVWFLALGLFFGWLAPRLRRVQRYMPALMIASGAFFILIGALMFLGEFQRLNAYFAGFGFFFGQTSGAEESLRGGVTGLAGPGVAFFGGVISFLSPCVLPLVPAYLVNIAGEAVLAGREATGAERRRVFRHAVAFVLGFTLVFAALGASAGFVGGLLVDRLDLLTRIGGLVLVVFGMQMSGLVHLPFLDRTYAFRVD